MVLYYSMCINWIFLRYFYYLEHLLFSLPLNKKPFIFRIESVVLFSLVIIVILFIFKFIRLLFVWRACIYLSYLFCVVFNSEPIWTLSSTKLPSYCDQHTIFWRYCLNCIWMKVRLLAILSNFLIFFVTIWPHEGFMGWISISYDSHRWNLHTFYSICYVVLGNHIKTI